MRKIVMFLRQYDLRQQDLTRWCRTCLSSAPAVKKFHFKNPRWWSADMLERAAVHRDVDWFVFARVSVGCMPVRDCTAGSVSILCCAPPLVQSHSHITAAVIWFTWSVHAENLSAAHTHTPFNGPLSGTTQVSRYQKGKTSLDFTEARDSEWQWHQLGHMQVCTSLQTDNHASIPPLSFLQAGCPSCHPTNSVKALKCMTVNAECVLDVRRIASLVCQRQSSQRELTNWLKSWDWLTDWMSLLWHLTNRRWNYSACK